MTKEQLEKIDTNNTKAKEILKSMVTLMDEGNETVYFPALAEAALTFLEMNSGIFSNDGIK